MKTIIFDFDGVIHKYRNGWQDGSIYDEIDMDLIEYIKELQKADYAVAISTCRDAWQVVNHMNKVTDLPFCVTTGPFWNEKKFIGVSNMKLVGTLYIDDRGFRYTNLQSLKNYLGKTYTLKCSKCQVETITTEIDKYISNDCEWCGEESCFIINSRGLTE